MPAKPKRPGGKAGGKRPASRAAGGAGARPAAKAAPSTPRGPSRADRLEAARRERRRRSLWIRFGVAGLAVLLVAFVVYARLSSEGDRQALVDRLESGGGDCAHDRRFDGTAAEQGNHIPNPTYEVDPPAGGAHEPSAAAPGFYKAGGEVPADGKLVHAMEHGFVVLWYRPDVGPEDRATLDRLSDTFGRELILVPRMSLPGLVTLTAWHQRLQCDTLDAATVELFTTSYKDRGPEKGFL